MAHQLVLNSTLLDELKNLVETLPDGKPLQESKTVLPSTSAQTVTPDDGYDGMKKVVVAAIPMSSQTPIDVHLTDDGCFVASMRQTAGYVEQGGKSKTYNLSTQAARTIIPGTSDQKIRKATYLTGDQTIKGDANLVAANIISGKSIFGVAGSMQPKEFNIVTTVESGATVTATSGSTTISGTSNGTCTLKVPTAGTWTVKATTNLAEYNELETTSSKTITTVDTHSTTLTFFRAYINVATEVGATVTVSNSSTSYTKVATTGEVTFRVITTGSWSVHAVGANEEDTLTVSVTEAKTYGLSILGGFSSTLNNNEWSVISEHAAAGDAANYWAVGDTKEITINGTVGNTTFSSLSVWAFILGFDHNSSIEGTGRIHFQIGKTAQTGGTDICLIDSKYASSASSTAGYFSMNYSNSNSGGWASSKIRTVLLGSSYTPSSPLSGSLMAALPSDLLGVMKACTKYSDNTGGGSNTASYVTATTDYLWLPAEFEIFGSRRYANSTEQNYQAQYTYYANGNSKVKYCHSATSSPAYWWLRSTRVTSSYSFCFVGTSGSANYSAAAYASYGLGPAFCV